MSAAPGEYLVQYGRPAFVGRFASSGAFARGDRVVVRSPRGLELGVVLCEPAARFAAALGADGELIRLTSADDEAAAAAAESRAAELLALAETRAGAAAVLDAEVLLDGESAVLHAVAWGDTDLTPVLDDLSAATGLVVRLHDAGRDRLAPEPAAGCGKPGCGSESGGGCGTGGGCSTGGCSRAAVKSADELTSYFADLRGKMEAALGGRTPLN